MTSDFERLYQDKLCDPETAVSMFASGENLSMGMALGEPPALLNALSKRLDRGELEQLKLWYFHSMPAAAQTVLDYRHMDKLTPHCMFLGPTERALVEAGEAEGRKVINFVPSPSRTPRVSCLSTSH